MMNTVFSFFGRVILLYLLGFGAVYLLFSHSEEIKKVSLATLDRLRPETVDYLTGFYQKRYPFSAKKLEPFRFYYQKVTEYVPDRADAFGMLGFCSYYQGKQNQAVRAYQHAIELNPSFFWFYYNLGLIDFKSGRYQEAGELFKKSVTVDPQRTFLYIAASPRIYLPIVAELSPRDTRWDQLARAQLKNGYRDGYALLVLSQYHLKNFQGMIGYAHAAIEADLNQDGLFYFYSAVAAYELKQYPTTIYFLQEYISKNADNPEAYHYLGLALRDLGKEPLAAGAFKREEYLSQEKSKTVSLMDLAQDMDLQVY